VVSGSAGGADREYLLLRTDSRPSDRNVTPNYNLYRAYLGLLLSGSFERRLPLWLSNGLADVLGTRPVPAALARRTLAGPGPGRGIRGPGCPRERAAGLCHEHDPQLRSIQGRGPGHRRRRDDPSRPPGRGRGLAGVRPRGQGRPVEAQASIGDARTSDPRSRMSYDAEGRSRIGTRTSLEPRKRTPRPSSSDRRARAATTARRNSAGSRWPTRPRWRANGSVSNARSS